MAGKICQRSHQASLPCHLSVGSVWLQRPAPGRADTAVGCAVLAAAPMLGRALSSQSEGHAVAVTLLSQVQSRSRDTAETQALPLKRFLAGHGGTHLLSQDSGVRGRRIS